MSRAHKILILAATIAVFVAVSMLTESNNSDHAATSDSGAATAAPWYESLPANRWVELDAGNRSPIGYRTDHGGAVYVPERNSVFMFGSDSHLRNFDNGILELQLDELHWRQPYVRSPRYAMRTDKFGRRISGVDRLLPWPMHIYDAMVYDPVNRELIVLSGAKHSFITAPGKQIDPVWAYSPDQDRWRILKTRSNIDPNFFAAGAAYDSIRDTIVAYGAIADDTAFSAPGSEDQIVRTGVWELGPERSSWALLVDDAQHWGWFNVEYDVPNNSLIVFGGELDESSVWVYEIDRGRQEKGQLQRREPAGDVCPGGHYFPASFNSKLGLTLFIPPNRSAGTSVTCLYDSRTDTYTRLGGAELPWLGLNYTLIYASEINVHVLIAGSFSRNERTSVWVLKLDETAPRR